MRDFAVEYSPSPPSVPHNGCVESAWAWVGMGGLVVLVALLDRARASVRGAALRGASGLGLSPRDVVELNRIARRVIRDHLTPSSALVRHLCVIQERGTPVRRIEPTEWEGRWYLGFADGTSVVISADSPSTVLSLRVALLTGSVTVVGVSVVDHGLQLDLFGGRTRRRVLAVADA